MVSAFSGNAQGAPFGNARRGTGAGSANDLLGSDVRLKQARAEILELRAARHGS